MCWSGYLDQVLLAFGVLMLAIYLGARIHAAVLSRVALAAFNIEQSSSADQPGKGDQGPATPDVSLWSQKRIKDYEASLAAHFAPAIGVLRIPKIHVEVPILEGTDDLTLNRGVGRIEGTASPGENGNIGIAGHRDGFFRGLKDVGPGDTIEMVSAGRTETYVIDRVVIVDPNDVSVLAPRARPSLTLVTCYPFYFVGSAPKRYIVQASIKDSDAAGSHAVERPNADARNGNESKHQSN
jgi:sortase A